VSDELNAEQKRIHDLQKINEEQSERILQLEEQIAWFNRQIFGRKSEQHKGEALDELFDSDGLGKPETSSEDESPEEEDDAKKPKKIPRKTRKIRGQKIPGNLPIKTEHHDPEEYHDNPNAYRLLKEERRESLGKVPGYFYRKIDIYRTWVPKDQNPGDKALVAAAPKKIIPGGYWQCDLISEILCNRFLYHLPYHRQQALFRSRHGIELSKQTMSDAALQVAEQCRLLTDLMKRDILAGRYLRVDETKARYLDAEAEGGSSLGWFWLYKSENGNVLFDWQLSRAHRHFHDFIGEDFQGILGTDAYEAYLEYVKLQKARNRKVQRAACLAHVRRKFEEALGGALRSSQKSQPLPS